MALRARGVPALLAFAAVLSTLLFVGRFGSSPSGAPTSPPAVHVATLPIAFEPHHVTSDHSTLYQAQGRGFQLGLTRTGTTLSLRAGSHRAVVRSRLVGARLDRAIAERRLRGKVNYLVGPRKNWRTGVPTFGAVRFAQAWPGIDVRYHGDGGQVEYDFLLAAGADPSRISMRLSGANAMTISKSGDLLLHIPGGTLRQHAPVAFQGDARVPVSYALDGNDVRLRVGHYDRSRPLVIDPVVSFSSYLGGADSDQANGIAVDSTGAVIVAGDFYGGPTDVWLRKLAPGGSSVVWTTYVGGTGTESEGHVGVDGSNNVYVAGTTTSNDLPNRISGNTFKGGTTDAFVAKLPSSGASITWSKYIGSSGNDSGKAIAVDSSSVAVGGSSGGAVGNSFGTAGGTYAFAQRLDLNGATLGAFSVTGDGEDGGNAVGLSGTKVWLAGYTYALNSTPGFPVAGTPVQTGPATDGLGNYGYNGFVTLADTNGDPGALTCSTYFGSSDPQQDYVWGLAVGSDGNAHITGQLGNGSVSGVTFANSYAGGGDDAFVARLNNTCGLVSGSARYIGGAGYDRAWSIAVDSNNNETITGSTDGTLSGTVDTVQPRGGTTDAWVAKVKAGALVYATNFGGTGSDSPGAVALDSAGNAWVAGTTTATDFPLVNPLQGDQLNADGWVAKFAPAPPTVSGPGAATSDTTPTFDVTNRNTGGTVTCAFEPAVQATCAASNTAAPLSQGSHTFRVKAKDAGGTSATDVVKTFIVDSTAPAAFGLRSPAAGEQTGFSPTFSWDAASDPLSGIASYELFVGANKVASVDPATCTDGCSAQPPGPLAEGRYSWHVRAVDAAGNATDSETREFLAGANPVADFRIAPNPTLINRAVTFDASAATDENGGIANYEWDLDGDGSFETTGAAPSRTYATAGEVPITLRVTDGVGLTASKTETLRVTSPAGTGSQLGVSINSGAQYTNSPNVKLAVVFPNLTTSILVSNDGGFAAPTTFMPIKEIDWKLDSSGPERLPKTVYVRFQPSVTAGLTFTDDIILDERPPIVDQAALATPPAASSATVAAKKTYTVKVKAHDTNSGVRGVQVTASKRKPGKLLGYKRKLKVKATARPKFLRAMDKAGNYSRWKSLR